jgi:hypothetical protein
MDGPSSVLTCSLRAPLLLVKAEWVMELEL